LLLSAYPCRYKEKENKKTKNTKNKTAALIALFLMFAMAVSLFALPTANAQGTRATYAYIGAVPNPVGVGQEVLLHVGITQQLTNVAMGWDDLSVTITRPDGTTETLTGIKTDSTGGTGRVYVPTMVGNYTLQTHFPEQVTTNDKRAGGTPVGAVMQASDSEKLTLIVREEQVNVYPGHPLPTEYWTRPINAQFREWYTISGSWLRASSSIGALAPGNEEAPDTPHILWTKPLTTGGLVGGEPYGLIGSGGTSVGMETGDAYEGKYSNRLIIMGKLYYNTGAYDRPRLIHCVDLRTGEELWAKTFLDNRTISMGQLYYWQSYNYQGTFAYLWVTVGSDWYAFDPFTGEWMSTIRNVPSGTTITGERGEIYRYTVSLTGGYMQLWNLSALVSMQGSIGSSFCLREYNASSGQYRRQNSDGTFGSWTSPSASRVERSWAFNITIPNGLAGSVRAVALGDKVVGSSYNNSDVNIWAFSLKSGQEGTLLFNNNWKAPTAWAAGNQSLSWKDTSLESNVAVIWSKEECRNYGFSLETGKYLWVTEPQHYLDIYDQMSKIYYDKLYSAGVSGIVYCYDLTTGKTLWTYEANDPYTEILWANDWHTDIYFPCGGKLYFFHNMHSDNQPLPRGAPAFCLNATTGEVIWRVDGLFRDTHWGSEAIIGDNVIAMYNTYDQQVYAIGRGPSATTVTAGPEVSVHGSSVLVKGMVTDISPGTKQTALTLRFPSGVPAVADECVGEWMKYVYAQFARPADVVGVEVVVAVLDPNSNCYEVGRTRSDADGFFSCAFTPEVPGKYTIIASFAGSGAYYGSHAETAINVEEAPAATPAPTPTPASVADMYFLPVSIGMIVAIVIVLALLLLLMLRKR